MASTTTPIRSAFKGHLVAALRDRLGVQVSTVFPGDHYDDDTIYLLGPRGNMDAPLAMAGEKIRDDKWVQPVIIVAGAAGRDDLEADARAETWFSTLCEIVYEDMQLGGVVAGLELVELDQVDGPEPVATTEGFQSFLRADLACEGRIHPS